METGAKALMASVIRHYGTIRFSWEPCNFTLNIFQDFEQINTGTNKACQGKLVRELVKKLVKENLLVCAGLIHSPRNNQSNAQNPTHRAQQWLETRSHVTHITIPLQSIEWPRSSRSTRSSPQSTACTGNDPERCSLMRHCPDLPMGPGQ